MSLFGTFYQRFNADQFKSPKRGKQLSKIFNKSAILTGIQPQLLYFNLPEDLTKDLQKPKRLFPGKGKPADQDFPTVAHLVDFFSSYEHQTHQKQTSNIFLFKVDDYNGKSHVIGSYSSHGWDGQ